LPAQPASPRTASRRFYKLVLLAAAVACSDAGVAPTPGQPDTIASNLGTMNVGDVRVMTLSAASGGLSIPAELASAQYAIIIGNSDVASGSIADYQVRGDWLTPPSHTPVSDLFPSSARSGTFGETMSRGAEAEARLRLIERTELPRPGGRSSGAAAAAAADRMIPGPARETAPPAPGTLLQFKVLTPAGFNGSISSCSPAGFTSTTGMVKYVSQHAIVVSDITSPQPGFSYADFKSIGDEFDQLIYPTDVGYFGTPQDLDNNGHIFIYYTPAVNRLTPAGDAYLSGYVGGFFFAGDLYPPTTAGCLASNQGEIFYLLAPDPAAQFGNSFDDSFVRQVTRGTVAHEFQHMINSGNRYASPVRQLFESTWLDEGLAHFAEDAVGRAKADFGDQFLVTRANLLAVDTTTRQEFFNQNFARTKYYVERPDTTAAIVNNKKASANLASRGAEWALLRYAADWFNTGGDPRTLTRALAAGPDTGTVNLVKSTGVPLDTVLARFLVTLLTDQQPYLPSGSPYNYKSYAFRDIVSGTKIANQSGTAYLPVASVGGGATVLTAKVPPSSAAYFLTSPGASGSRLVRVTDSRGNPSADPSGRVYIVRVQ
jgi:hypothetical protein